MRLFDEKFKKHKARYVLQCVLATVSAMIVLTALKAIASAAVIGALGASAVIGFSMPQRRVARARYLIGGYLVGIIAGSTCYWLLRLFVSGEFPITDELASVIFAGLAVGLAIFLMVVTNTEHPPAAGLALGLVLGEWNSQTVLFILLGVICLVSLKRLLKPFLIDLL